MTYLRGANDDRLSAVPTRRLVLPGVAALSLLGLTGCMSRNNQSLAQRHVTVLRGLLAQRGQRPSLDKEKVAQIPYASMSVRVGRRGEQLILLNRIEGRKLLWLSGDQIMLVTRGGRLVQTGGLRFNLIDTSFVGSDPIADDPLSVDGKEATRMLDFDHGLGRSIEAKSHFRLRGKEPIEVLGTTLDTVLIEERVRVPLFKWRFKNKYWVHERSGFVWRTSQRFHPDYPALTLTVLRPAKLP